MTTLLIAMPTQGQINTKTVNSIIGLTQALRRQNIAFGWRTYEFSDIVFSRNQLASIFLTQKNFTHMLMLDSDMVFEPEVVLRLLAFNAPFTAVPYAQKKMQWRKFRSEIEKDLQLPEEQRREMGAILRGCWTYNHQPGAFPEKPFTRLHRDGFITVPATGTGMMCLARDVVEKMASTGAARPMPRLSQLPLHKGLEYHDFFSHLVDEEAGMMYAEDQSFCHRWVVQCDGEIWVDTRANVGHEGNWVWQSRWGDQIAMGGVADIPADFPWEPSPEDG